MRISKALVLVGLSVSFIACQKTELTVDAELTNVDDGFVYLSAINENMQWQNVDTAKVENGHFTFNTDKVSDAGECFMILTPRQQNLVFFAAKEDVEIVGDMDISSSIRVYGSKLQKKYDAFTSNIPEQEHLKRLNRELATSQYDIDKANALKEEIYSAQMEQLAYIKRYSSTNLSNPVGTFIIINSVNYFSFEEADDFSKKIQEQQPDHKYTKIFESIVENRRTIYEAMQKVEIGQIAPDFTLEDSKGENKSLSELRGKNVIINFWISNDRMSRNSNVSLAEVDKKFAKKNVQIVGISVDQNKERWLKALSEDKTPGIQLIDIENSVAATYCVPRLPYCILIDAEGKIVAKDQNAETVFSDVEALLTK